MLQHLFLYQQEPVIMLDNARTLPASHMPGQRQHHICQVSASISATLAQPAADTAANDHLLPQIQQCSSMWGPHSYTAAAANT
jgi:hypothetical protein